MFVSFKAPNCEYGDSRQFIYAERYGYLYSGVAPNILSLAGVKIPARMQGVNALNLLLNEAPKREEFFYEHNLDIPTIPKSEAVISPKYGYIKYSGLNPEFEELYNLEDDPNEKTNLVGDPDYAEGLEEYRLTLSRLASEAK